MTGSDLGGAFGGLAIISFLLVLGAPLAVWKAIEIVIWLIKHVNISIT